MRFLSYEKSLGGSRIGPKLSPFGRILDPPRGNKEVTATLSTSGEIWQIREENPN
jgi:hypothetical protein